ncbi:hypothetical protein ACE7GA_20445 [Roseomonas sp. CCTCC AB2023176]
MDLAPRSLMVIYGEKRVVSDPGSVAMNPDEVRRGLQALRGDGTGLRRE